MKVIAAEFEKSVVHGKDCPKDPLAEVAFAGRSNVGKSSMMNTLLGRKGLVKTSSTPGKTQTLNFFRVRTGGGGGGGGTEFRFVDLPGYGYAKAPDRVRKAWGKMVESYLEVREPLQGVVVILDIRRGAGDMDRDLLEWLASKGMASLVVLTKADKLSASKRAAASAQVRKDLSLGPEDPVTFSAANGMGKDALWRRLEPWVRNPAGFSRG